MHSPLIERLVHGLGYPLLDVQSHDTLIEQAGDTVLFFTEDPKRFPESDDVAVILPELVKAFPGRLRVGVVAREAEKTLQSRYGFAVWPALVFVRAGGYVGTITGVQDWAVFLEETRQMLEREPGRPPSVGIPVQAERSSDNACGSHPQS